MFVVNSSIDHETDRPKQFVLQAAQVARRILVKTEFLAETFRIQTPAFPVSGVPERMIERMDAREFLRD